MKAVVFYENGGVDKLTYTDVEKPKISPYEVLVKVRACALNHLDIWVRQGLPGIEIPMPHILGSDSVGRGGRGGYGGEAIQGWVTRCSLPPVFAAGSV